MSVIVECSECLKQCQVAEASIGGEVQCKACGHIIPVALVMPVPQQLPSPGLAAVLGAISPGLGMIYLGQIIVGLAISTFHGFLLWTFFTSKESAAYGTLFWCLVMQLLASLNAYDAAKKRH